MMWASVAQNRTLANGRRLALDILFAVELVAEVGDERRANGPIECHAGRGRIWNGEQVLVEPAQFAVGENADLTLAQAQVSTLNRCVPAPIILVSEQN